MILMLLLLVFFCHDCSPIDVKISKYILYNHIIYIFIYIILYILYIIYIYYMYVLCIWYIYVKHGNRNPFNKVGSPNGSGNS